MDGEFLFLDSVDSQARQRRPRASPLAFLVLAMAPALAVLIGCADSEPQATDDEIRVFELTIEKRSLAVPDRVIRVRQGEQVMLRWLTDEPATVHLHGYDIRASLEPGAPVVWDFEANATGRFPIEAHGFGQLEEPARTRDGSHDHDHSDHHDHSAQEPASTAGPTEKTLLYFEVHPR